MSTEKGAISLPGIRYSLYKYISLLSSFILAALFLYAAYDKITDHTEFVQSLNSAPHLNNLGTIIGWTLPALEIIITVLLLLKRTRTIGLWSAFILLLFLTAYVFILIKYPYQPCTCLGIFPNLSWNNHLFINLGFLLLALLALSFTDRKQ